jgi:hypothetical protein
MDQPIMDLADQLAPLERFAVAYAPAAARRRGSACSRSNSAWPIPRSRGAMR